MHLYSGLYVNLWKHLSVGQVPHQFYLSEYNFHLSQYKYLLLMLCEYNISVIIYLKIFCVYIWITSQMLSWKLNYWKCFDNFVRKLDDLLYQCRVHSWSICTINYSVENFGTYYFIKTIQCESKTSWFGQLFFFKLSNGYFIDMLYSCYTHILYQRAHMNI